MGNSTLFLIFVARFQDFSVQFVLVLKYLYGMEELKFKTQITKHAYDRIEERLNKMRFNKDITVEEATNIESVFKKILNHDFENQKSYGIFLGRFNINPTSKLITRKHKSGTYYEINSMDEFDIIKDSTGNEFWVIIRNKKLVTGFLRKTVQRATAEKARDFGGLGVDCVIDDINKIHISIKQKDGLKETIRYSGKMPS